MVSFVIIILLLLICGGLLLASWPEADNGPFYIDDGVDHCADCEVCSKESCKHCIFNRHNGK